MELLDQYFKLQDEIYDYFDYEEVLEVIPIDDSRQFYWLLIENGNGGGKVLFSDRVLTETMIQEYDFYYNEIYIQRFLTRWIYRGQEFTMICVDTLIDGGNKFLQIFDNAKESECSTTTRVVASRPEPETAFPVSKY